MQTSQSVCILLYQLVRIWVVMSFVTVHLGSLNADTFSYLVLRHRKKSVVRYWIYFALWSHSDSLFIL